MTLDLTLDSQMWYQENEQQKKRKMFELKIQIKNLCIKGCFQENEKKNFGKMYLQIIYPMKYYTKCKEL